jgi:exodeoxyribonuclease VII small subunit
MEKTLTYDEAMARLETLTKELASIGAVGMDEYKQKALEAQQLIAYCHSCLTELESQITKPE